MKLSSTKLFLYPAIILGCGFLAYFFQPSLRQNHAFIEVITTVFSILAGFLVAIITIVAEIPEFNKPNWRKYEIFRKQIESKLIKYQILFFVYIGTLGFVFGYTLVSDKSLMLYGFDFKPLYEFLLLFMSFIGLIFSLGLPRALINFRMSRYDEIIESYRQEAGIKEN